MEVSDQENQIMEFIVDSSTVKMIDNKTSFKIHHSGLVTQSESSESSLRDTYLLFRKIVNIVKDDI